MRTLLSYSGLVLLAGCAATSPSVPPAPAGVMLRYAVTAPATATYAFMDSSGFNIRGGAIGDIAVTAVANGTADATLAPRDSTSSELRIKITDLTGSFTNSAMGGTINATEADVQGEAVLALTPGGVMTVVQLPTTTRNAQGVGMGVGFFRRFTTRLPAGSVQRGSTWTDTVMVSEDNAGMKTAVTDVVTTTWARDTVVAARTLNVLTYSTHRTLDISGTTEGVQIAQKLSGTATGYTLWDPQRSLVAERYENTDLSGTFDLPAMGISGLPITAKGIGRITLR